MALGGGTLALAAVFVKQLLAEALGGVGTEAAACNVIEFLIARAEGQSVGWTLTLACLWIVNLASGTLVHDGTAAAAGRVVESLVPGTVRWPVGTVTPASLLHKDLRWYTWPHCRTLTAAALLIERLWWAAVAL